MVTFLAESLLGRTARATLRIAIAASTKDRRGRPLPEVHWLIGGHQKVWEVLRRWALEVLRLPANRVPGGSEGSAAAFEKKGIAVMGRDGPLPLDAPLADLAAELSVRGGHRVLTVEWPVTALPSEWRKRPSTNRPAGKSSAECTDCGGMLEFRKARQDGGFRTLAICGECNMIKGALISRGGGGRGRSRSRGR